MLSRRQVHSQEMFVSTVRWFALGSILVCVVGVLLEWRVFVGKQPAASGSGNEVLTNHPAELSLSSIALGMGEMQLIILGEDPRWSVVAHIPIPDPPPVGMNQVSIVGSEERQMFAWCRRLSKGLRREDLWDHSHRDDYPEVVEEYVGVSGQAEVDVKAVEVDRIYAGRMRKGYLVRVRLSDIVFCDADGNPTYKITSYLADDLLTGWLPP